MLSAARASGREARKLPERSTLSILVVRRMVMVVVLVMVVMIVMVIRERKMMMEVKNRFMLVLKRQQDMKRFVKQRL